MRTFEVEDDLVELIWKLADPEPFESLAFSDALRRVLELHLTEAPQEATKESVEELIERLLANAPDLPRKAPTPSPAEWVSSVPELCSKKHLTTWKAICDELSIDPAGDSARRKLKTWVADNRPKWPDVPEPGRVGA